MDLGICFAYCRWWKYSRCTNKFPVYIPVCAAHQVCKGQCLECFGGFLTEKYIT